MRKSISLVAALALSSSVAFAGYGSNAGYSTTKKINIENQQWILVGYPGGSAVSTPSTGSTTVAAQDSIPGTSTYNGNIYYPANWNNEIVGGVDTNNTIYLGEGTEDNATFNIEAKSTYWSQLLAHSSYSISNVGEPAVVFTQSPDFMNLATGTSVPAGTMVIKLDGTDTTTDAILEIDLHNQYVGKTFTLYLDANESNNTSYTMTAVIGTAYILNDPNAGSSSRPTTNQLLEFNTTLGYGHYGTASSIASDNNFSFGIASDGLNYFDIGDISKDANYTVAKFNAAGQSWMTYEANLTGDFVISDGGLQNTSEDVNTVEKGSAYWYRLNLKPTLNDLNMSVTVRDEDVGVSDLSLLDDRWHLTSLPKGHIKHSQGGIIIGTTTAAGEPVYLNFKGTVGNIEDVTPSSILVSEAAGGASSLVAAKNINNFIDGNGTLFEVPIRAYPSGTQTVLIISDTQVDFNMSSTGSAMSIGGASLGTSGQTILGESAIAIKMNEGFFDRVGAGTFTIEIPDLFSGFTGVDVNLSGVATTGAAVAASLTALQSNIETAMYNQACLHSKGGDYNITTFDSDFDAVDDSFLIALRAKSERNITADTTNPTACTTNGVTRDAYNDKYLRIGVRENTYVTPYLNKKDGNYTALHVVDTSGRTYAKGSITTGTTSAAITIADAGYNAATTIGTAGALSIEGNRTTLFGSYVDWNLSTGTPIDGTAVPADDADNNYTYFVTSSRTLMLAESNVTDYNLSGASKYSILSQTNKNDVLTDARYLSYATRITSPWVTDSSDVNSTFLKGVISNVFTLADLAQAPLNSGGDLSGASGGIAGYSSSTDLNVNTVWSVDMPTSGPLYDIISATPAGTIPSRILTFRNGSYVSINFNKTTNTSEWFDTEDLYFISAFNGYWVRTDSQMTSYTINTATSADSGEKVIRTTYDMTDGTTTNYVFNKWIVDNVGSSSGLDTSMHNISVGDSNMSAQFTSVSSGAERYEILIDPFTFPDFVETGFGTTTKSIVITNGFTSSTLGSPITYSYTKPSAPTVSGTSNNDLTVSAVDTTLKVHLSYVDEANLSFTRLFSQTDTAVTIKPQDLNVSSVFTTGAGYDMIGSDINETKIRLFNVGADGLSSDVTTVIYPLFNVMLINPSTTGAEYNLSLATMSDVNQSEWIDADGDGGGTQEELVVYNIISDDGSDNVANAIPSRYDANGTLITVNANHPDFAGGLATDGVQILSETGSTVSLSYRPNGVTTAPILSTDYKSMDIYDGTSGVKTYIAKVSFRDNTNNYDYNGTKWYLNATVNGASKMYVGLFETNSTSSNTFIDCSDTATNCNILNTTRTMSE